MSTTPTLISWSGGKDIALASLKALEMGLHPTHLLTMMDESGQRSRSHGLSLALLQAQASALNMQLITQACTWSTYEETFIHSLQKAHDIGITHCVFGDIDLEEHRLWEEKVAQAATLQPILPLWQQPRLELVEAVISTGIKPIICTILSARVPTHFLGRCFDRACVDELIALGIDPCGEGGEFHTVVMDAPHFHHPISYRTGQQHATATTLSIDILV